MDPTIIAANIIGVVISLGACVWVSMDARAIGTDHGQAPGIVNTRPGAWTFGVFLVWFVFLPLYLLMRVRYQRLAEQRRAAYPRLVPATVPDAPGVWPPPPNIPAG